MQPERPAQRRLAAEEHVAGDVEVSARFSSWWISAMPRPLGVLDAREVDRLAVEQDLAGVGRVDAGQDLHQRRFAGAVLADDGQHLARHARAATRRRAPGRRESAC